jgi:hypothetical protein
MDKRHTNRILGYLDEARRLIINADDFGMCNSINEAIMQTLMTGCGSFNKLDVALSMGVSCDALSRRSARYSVWSTPDSDL